jgi:hypothetical protein
MGTGEAKYSTNFHLVLYFSGGVNLNLQKTIEKNCINKCATSN